MKTTHLLSLYKEPRKASIFAHYKWLTTIFTLPNWINWGTIFSTVEDGMANPTPADVPATQTRIFFA